MSEINEFKNIKISAVKNSIMVSSSSTFFALKPRKNHLDIEFLLDREVNKTFVYKTFRVSKNRVAHFVRLEVSSEINKILMNLLKRSYKMMNNK